MLSGEYPVIDPPRFPEDEGERQRDTEPDRAQSTDERKIAMSTSVQAGSPPGSTFVRAAALDEVRRAGCMIVHIEGQTIALFFHEGIVYAVDNRCPHMGFPLERGTVKDCILTCHWHHARFDLASGGTFDPWADDVRVFPVEIRQDEAWVDVKPPGDLPSHHRRRVRDGLERNLPLVIAKAVIFLVDQGDDPAKPFRIQTALKSSTAIQSRS